MAHLPEAPPPYYHQTLETLEAASTAEELDELADNVMAEHQRTKSKIAKYEAISDLIERFGNLNPNLNPVIQNATYRGHSRVLRKIMKLHQSLHYDFALMDRVLERMREKVREAEARRDQSRRELREVIAEVGANLDAEEAKEVRNKFKMAAC